eukprot:c7167_g1_i1.p1 GENE.c7167_g1_i1~~c7167_g1_i1.p1  ORF type:complete len:244 (+),score=99.49 c7167_g1_i1:23-733(+)
MYQNDTDEGIFSILYEILQLVLPAFLVVIFYFNYPSAYRWWSQFSLQKTPLDQGFETIITCGSIIKLSHYQSQCLLSSSQIRVDLGSRSQLVSCTSDFFSSDNFWIVQTQNDDCERGEPIKNGQTISLLHMNTNKYISSDHRFQSPISNHQEVSGQDQKQENEIFIVQWDNKFGGLWRRGVATQFYHVRSNNYLCSNIEYGFYRPEGNFEVYSQKNEENNCLWFGSGGVYFSSSIN